MSPLLAVGWPGCAPPSNPPQVSCYVSAGWHKEKPQGVRNCIVMAGSPGGLSLARRLSGSSSVYDVLDANISFVLFLVHHGYGQDPAPRFTSALCDRHAALTSRPLFTPAIVFNQVQTRWLPSQRRRMQAPSGGRPSSLTASHRVPSHPHACSRSTLVSRGHCRVDLAVGGWARHPVVHGQ